MTRTEAMKQLADLERFASSLFDDITRRGHFGEPMAVSYDWAMDLQRVTAHAAMWAARNLRDDE